jgi:acetyl esterase/lipase
MSAKGHSPIRTALGVAAVGTLAVGTAAALGARAIRRNQCANAEVTANVAPELRDVITMVPPGQLQGGLVSGTPKRGGVMDVLAAVMPAGIGEKVIIPGRDGAPEVPAYLYDPAGRERPGGAVLWIHGGGLIVGGPWLSHGICNRIAEELGVLVVSVDYRLAPEDPYPAGPEDCFTSLAWLHDHAEEFGIDPTRIAVGGDSAGGGLTAVVSQMAQDRGVPVAFQALIYPMLDDRTALTDRGEDVGRLVWTAQNHADAWGMFLEHPVTEEEPRPYASAARRENLAGQPPAWIGVGEIDLFHDEAVEYAARLQAAGVPVELLTVPGMFHAADAMGFVPSMRAFRDSMIEALAEGIGTD